MARIATSDFAQTARWRRRFWYCAFIILRQYGADFHISVCSDCDNLNMARILALRFAQTATSWRGFRHCTSSETQCNAGGRMLSKWCRGCQGIRWSRIASCHLSTAEYTTLTCLSLCESSESSASDTVSGLPTFPLSVKFLTLA